MTIINNINKWEVVVCQCAHTFNGEVIILKIGRLLYLVIIQKNKKQNKQQQKKKTKQNKNKRNKTKIDNIYLNCLNEYM